MAKKVLTLIKLQIPGGQANPAPPVGPALGQHGVNIMEFCKAFNAQTAQENGRIIPVEITVFEDRSFTFITKTPPAAVLIKEALGLESGSGEPNRDKVGRLSQAQLRSIAETKMPDLNARDVEEAMKVIAAPLALAWGGDGRRERARQALPRARASRSTASRRTRRSRRSGCSRASEGAKFDETVEAHFRLGLNVRHADQQLRGTIMLPHGIGKDVRVAVFAEGEKAREAEEAGADVVGVGRPRDEDRGGLPRLRRRDRDARPDGQRRQARPRARPARADAEPEDGHGHVRHRKAVADAKAGKLEYRTDRGGNVHLPIGKRSFDERALLENYAALVEEIVRAKPSAAKGRYIRQITLTTTMGPGSTSTRPRRGTSPRSSTSDRYSPGLTTDDTPAEDSRQPARSGQRSGRGRFHRRAPASDRARLARVSSFQEDTTC